MNSIVKAALGPLVRSAMAKRNVQFEEGLYAGLCGTGSPMPDINRTGSCIAVLAGKHFFIVDAGEGSTRNVLLMNLPLARADAILLTHFHSDHIADLGEMMLQRWAGGSNKTPLEVIGPTGVERVVQGFNLAYQLDAGYRVAHHGPEMVPPAGAGGIAKPFELSGEPNAAVVVFEQDGVRVTAFKVDHRPVEPAVGYRFDYRGRSVAVSGDTVYSESLLEHSRGADVLFHEALNLEMVRLMNENARLVNSPSLKKVTQDIPSYHSTPEQAARIASAAQVGHLIYYHIIPPLPRPMLKNLFLGDAKNYYRGPITVGEDGMLVFLPPDSGRIEIKNVLK
ncbi:MAG TPA: MBL fold metallo-hydrolase [Anaerolineales bacterium]|nr:MBL fold metallo-hydrolase [Anaerolineales bacterium]